MLPVSLALDNYNEGRFKKGLGGKWTYKEEYKSVHVYTIAYTVLSPLV